jgi:hypothetical protein
MNTEPIPLAAVAHQQAMVKVIEQIEHNPADSLTAESATGPELPIIAPEIVIKEESVPIADIPAAAESRPLSLDRDLSLPVSSPAESDQIHEIATDPQEASEMPIFESPAHFEPMPIDDLFQQESPQTVELLEPVPESSMQITEDIEAFAALFLPLDTSENPSLYITPAEQETPETQDAVEPIPPVCVEVTAKITELDPAPAEIAFAILQEISEKIETVIALRHEENGEVALVAEAELEQLCIELFEYLGIEYTPETVMEFVTGIMRVRQMPEFQSVEPADIQDDGTHEDKHHTDHDFSQLAQLFELPFMRALGSLTLRLTHAA